MKLLFDERAILGSQGRVRQGLSLTTAGSGKNALAYKQTRVDPQRYPPSGFASNRARRVVKSLAYPLPKITNSLTPLRAQQQRNAPNSTHRAHSFHTIYDAGGALAAEYSTASPPPIPMTSYLTTDHLGSPRVITDTSGAVLSRRDFMPFGEELDAGVGPRTEAMKYSVTGSDNMRQRFTGYEKDQETALDFAEARMYQNKHGRFTAPDPLLASASATNPQTFNRYTYTGNDPINYTDPGGLKWCRNSSGSTQFTGEGVPCEKGWSDVDGAEATVGDCGSVTYCSDNNVSEGDRVRLLSTGQMELILTPEQTAEANNLAVVVQDTGAEALTTDATTLSDHAASAFMTVAENNGAAQLVNLVTGSDPYTHHTSAGQTAGNLFSLGQGAAEIVQGLTIAAGGGAATTFTAPACLSGVGCIIPMATGAVSAAGVLEAMHGSGVIGLTVYNMVNNQGPGSRAGDSEGIYEFPDAEQPGTTYVGQSGNVPKRVKAHERTGKKSADSVAKTKTVRGGKTKREIAEYKRIKKLGGVKGTPGSKTSNVRNPIGQSRRKKLGLE